MQLVVLQHCKHSNVRDIRNVYTISIFYAAQY